MLKLPVYNLEGKETDNLEFKDKAFRTEFNPELVHQIMVSQKNNQRVYKAHAKTRGEVKGGGKKPWKQKGTGRARAGSIRSPLWVGGGVTFGPRNNRNYTTKINKKVSKLALAMAFAKKSTEKEVRLVENWKLSEPKTKVLTGILDKLEAKGQSVLLVTEAKNDGLNRAASNLPNVEVKTSNSINMLDLVTYRFILIEKEAAKVLEARVAAKPTK